MIEIKNVSKSYDKNLFEGFSYTFNNGIYQICGENGSGKSTLLNIITKKITTDGQISINGINIDEISYEEINQQYITYITQEDNLIDNLTVRQNFELFTQNYDNKYLRKLIDIFDMNSKTESKVATLSGGERKKVQLIIGLVFKRNILILDEPDNHLDDESFTKLVKIINNYSGTVIVVMHNTVKLNNVTKVYLDKPNDKQNIEDSINSKIDFTYKIKNFKIILKSKLNVVLLVCLIAILCIQALLIVDSKISLSVYKGNDIKFFKDDTTVVIYPPYNNSYSAQFQQDYWFDKTPLLFTEKQFDLLEKSQYVNQIVPLESDPGSGYSSIEFDGKEYTSQNFDTNYIQFPNEITFKIGVSGAPYDYVTGAIPKDNSNEILLSEDYARQNNISVGDTYTETFKNISDDSDVITRSFLVTGTIEGFNENYIAYDSNSQYANDSNINKNEEEKVLDIDYVILNIPRSVVPKDIDYEQNYYFGFVLTTDNKEDTIKLLEELYDYDPYMEIRSNYSSEFGILKKYQDEYIINKMISQLKISAVFLVILLLMYILNLRIINAKIIEKLSNYGFDNNNIVKLTNTLKKRYIIIGLCSFSYIPINIILFYSKTTLIYNISSFILISIIFILIITLINYILNKLRGKQK